MHHEGQEYEEFVNKFLKGKKISHDKSYADIQTKKLLYEVKGTRMYQLLSKNKMQLGKYQIKIENHNRLKLESEIIKLEPKYAFVVKLGNRMIFKTMKWEIINLFITLDARKIKTRNNGDEIYNLNLKEVWD